MTPEKLAQLFHETYERLAPDYGYRTREASAKPWLDVPEQNRTLMIATCAHVLDELDAAIAELIRTAKVEITWPDEEPAEARRRARTALSDAIASGSATPLAEWERALLERQADEPNPEPAPTAFRETGPDLNAEYGHLVLTPAQVIRLGVFQSLADMAAAPFPGDLDDVLALVVRAAQVIETGELDDLEDAPEADETERIRAERDWARLVRTPITSGDLPPSLRPTPRQEGSDDAR